MKSRQTSLAALLVAMLFLHSGCSSRERMRWTALHADLERNTELTGVWKDIAASPEDHVPWLVAVAEEHNDHWARSRALTVLRVVATPEALSVLTNALYADSSYVVRHTVAEQLGDTEQSDFVPVLLHCLEHDPHYYPRCSAAGSIGRLGDKTLTPRLIAAYSNESDSTTQQWIVRALGNLGGTNATLALVDTLLNNTNVLVRHHAALALRHIADPRSLDALRHAAAHDDDLVVLWATSAVARIEESIQQAN